MKQFNKSFLKIVFAAIMICLAIACSDDFDINSLDETIFVRHKDADMPAYIRGNASEKVFLITLHGGPGGLGLSFSGQAFSEIESKYGVVYFDQRGSGNSQGNYTKNQLNIDVMAEDVLALVKVMKHKFGDDSRFFLLGASWGGALGIATLLKDQNGFEGWIDVVGATNPAGLYNLNKEALTATANTQIAIGNSLDFWESALTLVSQVNPTPNTADGDRLNFKGLEAEGKLFEDGFIDAGDNGNKGVNKYFVYNPRITNWNTRQIENILLYDRELFLTLDFTPQLPKITIPSLIISGRYDMRVPMASAQNAFESIGSEFKELLIFDRSGHSPIASEPEKFATEILRFMDAHK